MSIKYKRTIGDSDKPLESKRTKRLRVAICILYVFTISFSALPFVWGVKQDGDYGFVTLLNMMFDGFNYGADCIGVSIIAIILIAIPIIGFLVESFDKTRNIKCITGIICPMVGIFLICFGVGNFIRFISIGGVFSIITYIFICFLSTYLFLVRTEEKHTNLNEKRRSGPKHNFSIDK